MSRKVFTVAAAAIVGGLAGISSASAYDRVDQRQANQQERIRAGVASGQIDRGEYRQLQGEQARIAALERQFKRDGRLSYAERAELERLQDRASRNIKQERHDANNRRGVFGGPRFGQRYGNDYGYRPWYRRWW